MRGYNPEPETVEDLDYNMRVLATNLLEMIEEIKKRLDEIEGQLKQGECGE